jgi:hypothetical protein
MPSQETLILAVTKMLGGVCIAGMTTQPDPITGLCWVRPTREFGHVLLGDITTAKGAVLRPFDVVEFNLLRPHPDPPHTEDWITDFVRCRPRIVRRLKGERRASFLSKYLDSAPGQVLDEQERSLCLIKPELIKGCFHFDPYSDHYEARLSFGLQGRPHLGSAAKGGISVTDLKWRALGRTWLPAGGGRVDFEGDEIKARTGAREIYLAVGLTRSYKGGFWSIIVGVHTWPDYQADVDYENL